MPGNLQIHHIYLLPIYEYAAINVVLIITPLFSPPPLPWFCSSLFMFQSRLFFFFHLYLQAGVRGGADGRGTPLQAGKVRFPIRSLELFTDLILPTALWPWGRLNR